MANTTLDLSGITPMGGFLLANRGPLDARTVVPTYEDLTTLATDYYIYEGILVYVKDKQTYYTYKNSQWEEFNAKPKINFTKIIRN